MVNVTLRIHWLNYTWKNVRKIKLHEKKRVRIEVIGK